MPNIGSCVVEINLQRHIDVDQHAGDRIDCDSVSLMNVNAALRLDGKCSDSCIKSLDVDRRCAIRIVMIPDESVFGSKRHRHSINIQQSGVGVDDAAAGG